MRTYKLPDYLIDMNRTMEKSTIRLFRLFDEVGYQGWIGCEYKPRGLTEEGLGWFDARR